MKNEKTICNLRLEAKVNESIRRPFLCTVLSGRWLSSWRSEVESGMHDKQEGKVSHRTIPVSWQLSLSRLCASP